MRTFIAVAAFSVALSGMAQEPRFRVIDLVTRFELPPGAEVMDINNRGDIIAAGGGTGFLLANGTVRELPRPRGALDYWPDEINENGLILGTGVYGGGHDPKVSVIWTSGVVGFPNVAPAIGSGSGGPLHSMNDLAVFVGADHSIWRPIRWSSGLGLRYLPSPPGIGSATAINNPGVVVGVVTAGGIKRAHRWIGGIAQNLHPVGYQATVPGAIAEDGTISGQAVSDSGRYTAAIWQNGVEFMECGGLTEGGWSFFNDANNRGQVVGWAAIGQNMAAFLWEEGQMHNLEHLIDSRSGITFTTALAINDRGWILAAGRRGTQPTRFLLIPTN